MISDSLPRPERREFLGKLAAGAIALGLTGTATTTAFAAESKPSTDSVPSDKWLTALTGKHRQLFDMPNHENGMGLIHVRNYLNTMRDTYHAQHPDVTAVVTLYGMSTMMAFNDAMWKKYGVANPLKVMDGSNAAATANVFAAAPPGAENLFVSGAPIGIPA
ncbi:MAG TPA: twin-arginine translocation signal domain-containing protein, partial [Gemmatimonadaceae bacterium]|nr:twin-arginine translocation signal domain-containing protein [Gemmatimonadaceae bacterium]